MPKVVINEYDLTKPGTREYSNFSVVVPGFVKEGKDTSFFDENGIYEFSDQNEFVEKVGKTSCVINIRREVSSAVAPVVTAIFEIAEQLAVDSTHTKEEGATKPHVFKFRTRELFNAAMTQVAAGSYPTCSHNVGDSCPITDKDISADFDLYYAVPNSSNEIGALRTAELQFKHAEEFKIKDESHVVSVVDGALVIDDVKVPEHNAYYLIRTRASEEGTTDNTGRDASYIETKVTHYGNQIAYELLGLGYTVLYKKMTNVAPEELTYDTDAVLATGDGYLYYPANNNPISQLGDLSFWEALKDKSTYDFRYVVTGLMNENDAANSAIIALCDRSVNTTLDEASLTDGRGDCIALVDIDCDAYAGLTQKEAVPKMAVEAAKWASPYCAVFAPYVTYIMAEDAEYNNNSTFPASFHYLACAANSANNNYSEWYANAGYTRGVSKYTIKTTGCKLGEIAIQALEPRFVIPVGNTLDEDTQENIPVNTTVAVNLIVNIKNNYYLWGNRTAKNLDANDLVAQHFLNIRQLCTTIKKQVYTTCRKLTFDPNSSVLWLNFRSLLTPMLEKMKADQGIKDYMFVKNNTDRKALLSAKIRIVPIEAVEDFEIGLYLEDSLSEVAVTE